MKTFKVQALHYLGIGKSKKEKELHYWVDVSIPASRYKCRKFIGTMKSTESGMEFRNGLPFYVKYRLAPIS